MNVNIFKLISGEEVIAKIINETDDAFIIEDARMIIMQPAPNTGSVNVALLPFIATSVDATIELNKQWIVHRNETVNKGMEDEYVRMTSSIEIAR